MTKNFRTATRQVLDPIKLKDIRRKSFLHLLSPVHFSLDNKFSREGRKDVQEDIADIALDAFSLTRTFISELFAGES